MKKKILITTLLSIAAINLLPAQIQLPWSVVDRGGGKSTAGGIALQSSIGQPAVQTMSAAGFNLEGGYIPGVRALSGTSSSLDLSLEDGWNMVSVPLLVSDYRKTTLYPTAVSSAFAYQGSYQARDTLQNGEGYWLKYASAATAQFSGTSFVRETIDVADNWNMIGGVSYPALITDVTPIAPTTVASNYFGYSSSSGYFVEDTLKPGKAYWIKVNNTGQIVLRSGSVLIEPLSSTSTMATDDKQSQDMALQEAYNILTLKDAQGSERKLYFSSKTGDIDVKKYELPPRAPEGIMDVRYKSNRMVEIAEGGIIREIPILISSAIYPIRIQWSTVDGEAATLLVDGKEIIMKGTGTALISNPSTSRVVDQSPIRLRLSPASAQEMPKVFMLHQNYPNPFNPTTTLRYDLPKDAHVSLKIFNALGQEIKTLVDEMQDAGFKSVEWGGTNAHGAAVASGLYFYRLQALGTTDHRTTFTEVKRMLLLK